MQPPLWPHQARALAEIQQALKRGFRRIVLSCPTGGGKTRLMVELILRYGAFARPVTLYTNRRLLLEQTSRVLAEAGVWHGLRAADHPTDPDAPAQLSSLQTEWARCVRSRRWELTDPDLALVDEGHLMKGRSALAILERHLERGAAYVLFTATPLGLGHMADLLIQAGQPSELRAAGAMVPAYHVAPDEPDLRRVQARLDSGRDLTHRQNAKAMMRPGLVGRVLEGWRRWNPQGHPTLLFAPGVPESRWLAQQFEAAGVRAAHMDGEEVYVDGQYYKASEEARARVLSDSRAGRLPVVCNRFVLREGADMPWVRHGVLATVFGSLQSYLQSCGRLLRACPEVGKTRAVAQDHGGNFRRFGSVNSDREWRLECTDRAASALLVDPWKNPPPGRPRPPEPTPCPRCHGPVLLGRDCPECGWRWRPSHAVRRVVQADGTLVPVRGDYYRPRRVRATRQAPAQWEKIYHAARSKKWDATFSAAYAFFFRRHRYWPPRDLPLMPVDPLDWFRKVRSVPRECLIPKESARERQRTI